MSQKVNFLPVSRPEISEEGIAALVDVVRSGWIATGPKTQEFEKSLSGYFGGRPALSMTSNTVGMYTALKALGIGSGDYVITTPLTFVATVNVIESVGATPIFADVERETFNIDVKEIEKIDNDKVKAVMPVHYAGLPVDIDSLNELAQARGWRVIEDAAHAMGAAYKNKKIGSFGDIQVFSFHPIKNMTTGEGGCITINSSDNDVKRFIELFRFHGIDRSIWDRFSKSGSSQMYDIAMPGLKFNMSDIQAVIGIYQLKELGAMNDSRRRLSARYRSAFTDLSFIGMQGIPGFEHVHSCHLFPVILEDTKTRDDLAMFLKDRNVGTTPYYSPVHLFSYYKNKYGYKAGDFPNAEYIGSRILCLPLYPSLSDNEQDYVIDQIMEFFDAKKQ